MSLNLALSELPALDAPVSTAHLSGREKAAIVVRLLLTNGAIPALSSLPESTQTDLAVQLARMAPVDQPTVDAVATEFADSIEHLGLSFPNGLEKALGLLDGVISASMLRDWSGLSLPPSDELRQPSCTSRHIGTLSDI